MRALIPLGLRQKLRHAIDAVFGDPTVPILKIGEVESWAVIPGRLRKGSRVVSGGAGKDISFEIELAEKYGCQVAVFDPSPTGLATFARTGNGLPGLTCFSLGLSATSNAVPFALPANPDEGSYTEPAEGEGRTEFQCVSPADALQRAGFTDIELLKLDIEGFEYGFLDAMLHLGLRPPQIAVEFHHFLAHIPFSRTLRCVLRLRKAGYRLVRKQRYDYLFVHKTALVGAAAPGANPPHA